MSGVASHELLRGGRDFAALGKRLFTRARVIADMTENERRKFC